MNRTQSRSATERVATFRHTRAVAIQWLVVSTLGFFGFSYAFGQVLATIQGRPLDPIVVPAFSSADIVGLLAVSLVVVALVVIPHELLHGVFMARYGGEPKYGVGISHFLFPFVYAETTETSYTRNQLLIALLAPFVGITAVGLIAMVIYPSPLFVVALAANAAGSVGDLWMAAVLLQYPPDVRVAPRSDGERGGFGIYASSESEAGRHPVAAFLSRIGFGAIGTAAVLSITFVGAVFASLASGSGTVTFGDTAGRWLLFRHEVNPHGPGAAHLEVGCSLLVAVSTVGGVGWALVRTLADRLRS